MMLIRTFVAPSDVEGVGVFAAEPVEKHQLIWRLDTEFDRVIPRALVEMRPPHISEFVARYAYPAHDDPEKLIVEMDNGRFMNHCETPNTDFTKIIEGFALRDIVEGEELVCNYNEFDPRYELLPSFISAHKRKTPRSNGIDVNI